MLFQVILGKTTTFARLSALVCVLCGISAGLGGCQDTLSDRDIEVIPLAEVRQLTSKPQQVALIDPRSPGEFSQGRIPGAVNITLPEVEDQKDSLDPRLAGYKALIVYGNDPGSAVARAMTKRLMRAGGKNVKLFSGGLAEWSGNGLKIDRDPAVTPIAPAPSR